MKFRTFKAVLLAGVAVGTTACESIQQALIDNGISMQQAFGGAAAALGLAGGIMLGDSDVEKILYGITLAVALGYVGSEIGKGLDENDKRLVAASTKAVLDEPVPEGAAVRSSGAPPVAAPEGAPVSGWQSASKPDTVAGKTTLLQVSDTPQGECRVVRQLVTINGDETSQDVKYCRQSGEWIKQTA